MNQETKIFNKVIRRRRRVERKRRRRIYRFEFSAKAIKKRNDYFMKRLSQQLQQQIRVEPPKLNFFQRIINKFKSLWTQIKIAI